MQTWRPDTCKCRFEMNLSNEFSFVGVLDKCEAHTTVADEDIYGVVFSNSDSEQKRKNLVLKEMIENDDLGLSEEYTTEDGGTSRRLLSSVTYEWHFTGTGDMRPLEVTITGATTEAEQDLQTFCTTSFGADTVVIL